MYLDLWTLPLLNFRAKNKRDAIICEKRIVDWRGQKVHFDNFFSVPTRSLEAKILIEFFGAKSASGSYQVILFLAFLFEHQLYNSRLKGIFIRQSA
jgi:hypothetical protein